MSGVTKAISNELYAQVIKSLKEVGKTGDVSRKLQAIKSARDHGISTVSKVFGVSRITIMKWISDYQDNGAKGLKLKPGRGRKSILTDEEQQTVKGDWLLEDSNLTLKAVRIRIEEVFKKKLSLSTTHNVMTP